MVAVVAKTLSMVPPVGMDALSCVNGFVALRLCSIAYIIYYYRNRITVIVKFTDLWFDSSNSEEAMVVKSGQ